MYMYCVWLTNGVRYLSYAHWNSTTATSTTTMSTTVTNVTDCCCSIQFKPLLTFRTGSVLYKADIKTSNVR